MKNGMAYIRVSTDDQLELSPESQLKEILQYARANDILLTEEHIFREEEGRSGRNAKKRPQFQRMIAEAKQHAKEIDVILVWKFSRFARNQEESIVYKSMLKQKCGIEVLSVSEPIVEGPFGSLIERIIEWMDEYYSIRLAGEVTRGMAEKHARGGVVSVPPFGYQMEDGRYVPDPERAPIVQMVFDKFVQEGLGYKQLAQLLNQMGIRSRRGGPIENRTIQYLLQNPAYIGKLRWSPGRKGWNVHKNQNLTDSTHEPIVSVELFEAAQKRILEIREKYPYRSQQRENCAMLQGLVRCSSCGKTLVRSGAGMQCYGYAHGVCKDSHYIGLEALEELVLSAIEEAFSTEQLTILRRERPTPAPAQDYAALIRREEQKLARAALAYEEGIDSLEEYRSKKARITEAIASLRAQIPPPPPPISAKRFIQKHSPLLPKLRDTTLSSQEKNEILRSFVDHIVFDRVYCKVKVYCYEMCQ